MVLAAERALFGEDHAAAGARMLAAWRLPEQIVATVTRHHERGVNDGDAALASARGVVEAAGYSDGLQRSFDVEGPAPVEPTVAARLHERVEQFRSALNSVAA